MSYAEFVGHDDGGDRDDYDSTWEPYQSPCGAAGHMSGYRGTLVPVRYGRFVHQTDRAALYEIGDSSIWLPIGLTEDDGDGLLLMPEWMATRNHLTAEVK